MGTSVNQPSPRTVGWNAVRAVYTHSEIPPARVATEVWRAVQGEGSFVKTLTSPGMFACYEMIHAAKSAEEAMSGLTKHAREYRDNSIIAEFARRAVPAAFSMPIPAAAAWRAGLFAQLTDYLVSRDVPGYAGDTGR